MEDNHTSKHDQNEAEPDPATSPDHSDSSSPMAVDSATVNEAGDANHERPRSSLRWEHTAEEPLSDGPTLYTGTTATSPSTGSIPPPQASNEQTGSQNADQTPGDQAKSVELPTNNVSTNSSTQQWTEATASSWTRPWKQETVEETGVWLCHSCAFQLDVDENPLEVDPDEIYERCDELNLGQPMQRDMEKPLTHRPCENCSGGMFCYNYFQDLL